MALKSRSSTRIEAKPKGASSRRGGQSRTKGDTTGKILKAEPKTNWDKLRRATPAQIRRSIAGDSDIHPTDEAFWKKAKIVMPRRKETVTIRLDADLLDWLRRERGYQTRVNAVLRAYMSVEEHAGWRGEA